VEYPDLSGEAQNAETQNHLSGVPQVARPAGESAEQVRVRDMSFDVDTDELNRDSNLSAFLASKKAAIEAGTLAKDTVDVEVLKVGFRPPADALPASRCVARSPWRRIKAADNIFNHGGGAGGRGSGGGGGSGDGDSGGGASGSADGARDERGHKV